MKPLPLPLWSGFFFGNSPVSRCRHPLPRSGAAGRIQQQLRRCRKISALRQFVPGSSRSRTWTVTPSGSQPESFAVEQGSDPAPCRLRTHGVRRGAASSPHRPEGRHVACVKRVSVVVTDRVLGFCHGHSRALFIFAANFTESAARRPSSNARRRASSSWARSSGERCNGPPGRFLPAPGLSSIRALNFHMPLGLHSNYLIFILSV